MTKINTKAIIDDGFNSELVETAFFDGILEMPIVAAPKEIVIPTRLLPFSKRGCSRDFSETLVTYEPDVKFREILVAPERFVEEFRRFRSGIVTLDSSLYWDMPLLAQMANTYRNRAIGCYYQRQGIPVITNVRWGDERSYTTKFLPEPFAFLGAPRHSIVAIGTYGCIRGREAEFQMISGLEAMLLYLQPEIVLVYGSMPERIFRRFAGFARFVHYPDWITLQKGGAGYGND